MIGYLVLLVSLLPLTGCGTGHGPEAPADALTPRGWLNPGSMIEANSFADYSRAVERLLRETRLPFNAARANEEVEMAAPREYPPSYKGDCTPGETRGIVLLVHGLSDTAWIMRDLARHFATRCFTARTLLLPGHGTRPGDLLAVRATHWQATLDRQVRLAHAESPTVIVVGFSLGAVLATRSVLAYPDSIAALISVSPAYALSSGRLAALAPWVLWFKPWIDRGVADDAMRYEAMPTRGVAETVRAMQRMHRELRQHGQLDTPWLLLQSLDDAVVVPEDNAALLRQRAGHPASRIVQLYSEQAVDATMPRTRWLRGSSDALRTHGVTHVAVPVAPDNPHYGIVGRYRNCGSTSPREREAVTRCEQADPVWFGTWNRPDIPGQPTARGTFNPAFDAMTTEIDRFLEDAL